MGLDANSSNSRPSKVPVTNMAPFSTAQQLLFLLALNTPLSSMAIISREFNANPFIGDEALHEPLITYLVAKQT